MGSAISHCIEVISLSNETLFQWAGILVTLLGGTLVGNLVSRKNSKEANAQTLIDQIQEERDYTNQQLVKRDEKIDNQNIKIDELYEMYHNLQTEYRKMAEEKRNLEWELASEVKIKKRLIEENAYTLRQELREKEKLLKENNELKEKVSELEERVSDLEKERIEKPLSQRATSD